MTEKTSDLERRPISNPETVKIYEDGKHRRYSPLFSVNGGAFAIAKLFSEKTISEKPRELLGNLTLRQLSVGMILFTAVMVADIFKFGTNMQKYVDVFHKEGKTVLLLIGLLICGGWFLVSW